MTPFVPLTMYGYLPLVILLFLLLPARRAVIVSMAIGWLFLPMTSFHLPGPFDYSKVTLTGVGVLLVATVFDPKRIFSFGMKWYDIPVVVLCLWPIGASMLNGLGVGLGYVAFNFTAYGTPYLLGRKYFGDREGLNDLVLGLCIAGLVYVPLCLYESRFAPVLHSMIYGFHQHSFAQTKQLGGWRPTVFMQHGLAVGMWMAATAAIAIGLWLGRRARVASLPTSVVAVAMIVTSFLCRSTGATALLVLGGLMLVGWRLFGIRVILLLLAIEPLVYMAARVSGALPNQTVLAGAEYVFRDAKVQSLRARLDQERVLIDKVRLSPLVGTGRLKFSDSGEDLPDVNAVDAMWIIMMVRYGAIGLMGFAGLLFLTPALALVRAGRTAWKSPWCAPIVSLVVVSILYLMDNLSNAMVNPLLILVPGALGGEFAMREMRKAFAARRSGEWTTRLAIPSATT